jgi:hypothetical protein
LPYVCGAGINPVLLRWLSTHREAINAVAAEHADTALALVSIVEDSHLASGYPNCDFVGAVSHGTVKAGAETALTAALREVAEEARLELPSIEGDNAEIDTPESWLPPPGPLRQSWCYDDERQTSRRGARLSSRVTVFCRIVPPSANFTACIVHREGKGKGKGTLIAIQDASGGEAGSDAGDAREEDTGLVSAMAALKA